MKTIFIKSTILLVFLTTIMSCKDNISSSNSNKCSDMKSYNIGVEEGGNQRRGSQMTGETFSCSEVWEQLYPNTNKECFCKGYQVGFNQ